MRRTILALIIILLISPPLCVRAADESGETDLIDDYVSLCGGWLERGIDEDALSEIEDIAPSFSAGEILGDAAAGNLSLSPTGILKYILRKMLGEIYSVFKIMGVVLALSILCSYLTALGGGFGSDGVSNAAYFACYAVIAGISAAAFIEVVTVAKTAIENMALFMHTIVPLSIALLVSSGLIVSAEVFEPAVLVVVEASVTIIKTAFIPLLIAAASINVADNISEKFNAEKLVALINNVVKWGLGIILTVFTGVVGLQSMSTSAADGMSLKITKYAASNLIPVVGGILSESVETVMNCSVIIKNAVGVAGVITLALIAVGPLVKIAASLLVFRITAAVVQPISDARIVKCMTGLASVVCMLFAIVASISIMFVIILTLVVNAGNTAVMLGR